MDLGVADERWRESGHGAGQLTVPVGDGFGQRGGERPGVGGAERLEMSAPFGHGSPHFPVDPRGESLHEPGVQEGLVARRDETGLAAGGLEAVDESSEWTGIGSPVYDDADAVAELRERDVGAVDDDELPEERAEAGERSFEEGFPAEGEKGLGPAHATAAPSAEKNQGGHAEPPLVMNPIVTAKGRDCDPPFRTAENDVFSAGGKGRGPVSVTVRGTIRQAPYLRNGRFGPIDRF